MAERGVSWENMENTKHMEKMQDINEMSLNTLFIIQNTLLWQKKLDLWHKTLFMLTRLLKTLYF